MPIANGVGEIIQDAKLTDKERYRLNWLTSFVYPKDAKTIFRLSPKDFRTWLYLQNPKEALLLCSTHGISNRVSEQLHPKKWKLFKDWWWRLWH